MKDLEIKKKAEESVIAAAGDDTSQNRKSSDSVAAFTSQNSDSVVAAGRFRACVEGRLGTATGPEDIDKALRQLFESCGEIEGIEGIRVNYRSWRAVIHFASLESLLKALQLNKTSFCDRPLTIYRERINRSTFRAGICGLEPGSEKLDVQLSLLDHFKVCGEIEDISILSPRYANIDFASLAALDKALELNYTKLRGHRITIADTHYNMGRFRAEIRGFDTGADDKKVEEGLRKHFKECGRIEGISVGATYACIDFQSVVSLFKALELNNTKVGDHTITVRQPEKDSIHTSRFNAAVIWSGYIELNALRSHFEKCGGLAGISYKGYNKFAVIYFTNMEALNKGLELDGSVIGDNEITVYEYKHDIVGS